MLIIFVQIFLHYFSIKPECVVYSFKTQHYSQPISIYVNTFIGIFKVFPQIFIELASYALPANLSQSAACFGHST
ncbi:hypothetical protein P879_05063 [Paragonimus westermani]|uniref:Uncharacterized protein n=1 Tax=Paragonimus westermani TaxID=34504 RepID=A0A8T0DGN8_9TREM|nr:hypothetical protein P879_05063 [Paragonimus westermani]